MGLRVPTNLGDDLTDPGLETFSGPSFFVQTRRIKWSPGLGGKGPGLERESPSELQTHYDQCLLQ